MGYSIFFPCRGGPTSPGGMPIIHFATKTRLKFQRRSSKIRKKSQFLHNFSVVSINNLSNKF